MWSNEVEEGLEYMSRHERLQDLLESMFNLYTDEADTMADKILERYSSCQNTAMDLLQYLEQEIDLIMTIHNR